MNKRVEMMCLGDVFVLDNGVTYAVVGCDGDLIQAVKTRPCLRLTHSLAHRVEDVSLDVVGRCIDWHELDRRIHEYQLSVLKMKHGDVVAEIARQAQVTGLRDGDNTTTSRKSPDEERCRLWLKRFRRAVTDADPTAMYSLDVGDLEALERVLNGFSRFRDELNAAHNKLDAAGLAFSPLVRRVEGLVAERDQAKKAKVVVDGPRAKYINDALDKAGVPQKFGGNDAILFDRVEWLIKKCDELTRVTAELPTLRQQPFDHDVAYLLSELLKQYNNSPMVTTYGTKLLTVSKNHIDAIQRLIADATKDANERRDSHKALTDAGVPTVLAERSVSLPERVAWLIAKANNTTSNDSAPAQKGPSITELFGRINKAIESLKPAFDAIEVTIAIRDSLEKCAQSAATEAAETTTNALDKALAESNARAKIERIKAHNASCKMVRKAWDLIQAARVTVDNKDVKPNEPRYMPTSLLEVFEFAQQQQEIADRELCAIDKDDESKAERAAYLRGVATAHKHVMALLAALGSRGYELIQHKFTE